MAKEKRSLEALELELSFLYELEEREDIACIEEIRKDLRAADVYCLARGMADGSGAYKSAAGEAGIQYLLDGEKPNKVERMLCRNFKNHGRLSLALR